jgi:hypothetical protein
LAPVSVSRPHAASLLRVRRPPIGEGAFETVFRTIEELRTEPHNQIGLIDTWERDAGMAERRLPGA